MADNDNNVNINITATDNASAAFKEASSNVSQFQDQIKNSGNSLGQFAAQTDQVKEKVNETGAATKGTGGALMAMGEQADGAAGGLEGLIKSFAIGSIAAQAVWTGIDKVKDVIHDIVGTAAEWQQEQAQLNAVLKSTGDASGMSAEQVDKLAESVQSSTPISREAALAGENMLLTFRSIGANEFPTATRAIDDMATAMNSGATPSASQLKDTAIQVGKALQDPILGVTTLRRVGVQLSDQQQQQVKDFIAVNDKADAQKVILNELSKEFGGSATAAAQTFSGAMQQLKNQAIDKLADAFQHLVNGLNSMTKWLEDHRVVLAALAGIFGGIAVAIGVALVPALVAATIAFGTMVIAAAPFLIIGAAVGAVAYEIITHWSDLKQWFSDFVNFVSGVKDAIVGIFKDAGKWLYDAGRDIVGGLINGIRDRIDDAVNAIKTVSNAIMNAAKSVLKIFSPSKVFTDIGGQVGAGLIQGLNDSNLEVSQASGQLAKSTIYSAQASARGVPSISSNNTNNNFVSHGGNTATVTIQNLNLSTQAAVQSFFEYIDQDNLLLSKGLSPSRGVSA